MVTLTFTASEAISTPAVTIAGHAVTATNSSANNWTATYTMVGGDTQANVAFSIGFIDLAGNTGTTVSATTDASSVTFDSTAPTLSSVTIASNNAITSKAKAGDAVTLSFTSSKAIATPTVTIAGHSVTASNSSGNNWTATYTMTGTDSQGNVAFSINFADLTGNAGTAVSATTDASVVTFDSTAPTVSSGSIASNNANPTKAKV